MEVNRQEASIRLKQSEIKNLQNELETLVQMIKQLEIQKIEAKKRLEEMSNQVNSRSIFFKNNCTFLLFSLNFYFSIYFLSLANF